MKPAYEASATAARRAALAMLARVLDKRHTLGEVMETNGLFQALDERDRGQAIALTRETLRQLGRIDDVLSEWIEKPLPASAGPARHILRLALAEIGFLATPAYAAGAAATDLAEADPKARHFLKLVNAVVRRAGRELAEALRRQRIGDVAAPPWLLKGWQEAYGKDGAAAIAAAHLREPPLDLTLAPSAASGEFLPRLGGFLLPTGALRLSGAGAVSGLAGFDEGAWWVQDAAAALPARLFGDIRGRSIIDLCAAPGGKTLQLAAAGAIVTAVDRSGERLQLVRDNLGRVGLNADLIEADAFAFEPQKLADGVLLDAPCTATGTIRRHPDLPWIKGADDIRAMAATQFDLLRRATGFVKPGGMIIYSVCSLEPAEGEEVIAALLEGDESLALEPIGRDEIPGAAEFITQEGYLRTLPSAWAEIGGLDGFFAARLRLRPAPA